MPPKERQKLQPREPEYFKGPAPYNPGREPEYFKGPAPYDPNREPGTGYLLPNMQEPWNNPGPGSFWNASLQSGDNSGIMAAALTDSRPDFQGNWLMNSDWGNRLLGLLGSRHGDEETQGKLREIIGGGGIDLWGGKLKPTWGDDRYGLNWEIGLGG